MTRLNEEHEETRREQLEDAAFWRVFYETSGHTETYQHEPIDDHAVYGYLRDEAPDVPHRSAPRDLLTAIRTLGSRHDLKHSPDDRVRVNGGSWMEVVSPAEDGAGFVDEGFLARYEDGSVLYAVRAMDMAHRGRDPSSPRMRRWDDHSSEGLVDYLEVDWGEL